MEYRFNDEFIYDCIKEKLQIVKTLREDSVQRRVHLRLHQGKKLQIVKTTREDSEISSVIYQKR